MSLTVPRTIGIAFCALWAGMSHAQSAGPRSLRFDLSKIGMVLDGRQLCEDKGRVARCAVEGDGPNHCRGAEGCTSFDWNDHRCAYGKDKRANHLLLAGYGRR